MSTSYCLLFDIYFADEIKQFIPTAYIASIENNTVQFVEKKAILPLLEAYKITISDHENDALNLCKLLKIENLYKKYNAKNKVKKPVGELLAEPASGKVILQYIHTKFAQFLNICKANNWFVTVQLNRDKPIDNQLVVFNNSHLQPNLHFKNESDKIIYTLTLLHENKPFFPVENQVKLLLNMPNWILLNQEIFEVDLINGNKIIPFITKKTIEIPQKTTQLYFDKFLKDVLNKVEIDAEGFDFERKNNLIGCMIHLIYDFFADCYFVNPEFLYDEQTSFFWNEKKEFRSKFVIDSTISIIQIKRNSSAEAIWFEKLEQIGFSIKNDAYFTLIDKKNLEKYEIVQYLQKNKTEIEQQGFEIADLLIEQKNISKNLGKMNISYLENEDWFDVKMQITCGEFTFSITEIISHLKERNPFYELPDGTFFMIPNEWFFDYTSLIEFATRTGSSLFLKKNQYPILEQVTSGSFQSEKALISWEYQPSSLVNATLRNYQKEGVKWLMEHHLNALGACLADDMGLGKTLQTLSVLAVVKEQFVEEQIIEPVDLFSNTIPEKKPLKALLIAPSSLLFNWANETKKFVPSFKVMTYYGKNRFELIPQMKHFDLILTSYSVALRDELFLKKENFNYLILDESHYIKNKNSKIFKVLNEINAENKITLSGTPIENSLDDLWSQMQFLNPNLLGEYPFFAHYFKFPIEKLKDEDKINELKNLINPYVLRRTKEQVLKDLPEVEAHYFISEMAPDQKSIYEKEKSVVRNLLLDDPSSKKNISVLNSLIKLRLLANHPKLVAENSGNSGKFKDITAYIETLVLAGKKVLIFSSFVKHLELYTAWCTENKIRFCTITGETSTANREKAVVEFQEDVTLLFFISLKAGGVGLNLTAASYILLLDPWWNPFAENQAIARAHRIGQKNKVTVVRFISKDTIEEKIVALQQKKKDISSSIIGTDEIPEELVLEELLA